MTQTHLTLNNGTSHIPKLAYGTGTKWFRRTDATTTEPKDAINQELVDSIITALRVGFTHIDTAEVYGTEAEVGVALGLYLKETGKKRSDVFVTTKVWTPFKDIKQSMNESLKRLGPSVEGYVDLYLIHSPFWAYDGPESSMPMQKAWIQMESLVTETKQARAIGVSNWRIQDFEALMATNPTIPPSLNQIEFHAYCQGRSLRAHQDTIQVVTAAYGPLQPLIKFVDSGSVQSVCDRIAAGKGAGVTGSQVLLAWGWAQGSVQVTTSAKEERMKEAVAALGVVLTREEVDEITRSGEGLSKRKFWEGKVFDD
ncbi:hypothetical protein HDU98_010278 [Podochytrium sp. JEL0797]|nr:hypothetical protein HDU98_010278 [Podochytrium sp. JEL0797]